MYPQPTNDELNETPIYTKTFNPFWWEIIQGFVSYLQDESLWEDYEAVREALDDLLTPDP